MTNLSKKNKKTVKIGSVVKTKINQYILKKQDICCENEFDKEIIIKEIYEKYKIIAAVALEPGQYLDYINNDLLKFIGYLYKLKNDKDIEGVKLWIFLNKIMMLKDNIISKNKIELLLQELPLYYLLSFLGYASYRVYSDKIYQKKNNKK